MADVDKAKVILGISEVQYKRIVERAERAGISEKAIMLVALDVGLNYMDCVDVMGNDGK